MFLPAYDIQMFALVKNGERLTANDYLCDVDVMDEVSAHKNSFEHWMMFIS